ncbi:serine/arginine repetitive matrix protein 1-like [Culicoides brevitarsis]|uniref:serine/arginine repetitive matrix protein 1-like n=1 Tax=Culicoides brevitarsis TaxID=469753 RepID=UPI00307B38F8
MEDEDLELLRKAALQSLQKKNSKPPPQETQQIQPLQAIQQPPQALNPRAAPFIPAQGPPAAQPWNNFGPQPVVPTPPMHYLPPHGVAPIHPQFMPNMLPTPPGVPVNVPLSIVPPVIAPTHVPNVQLSPRSAAFVSQNNDIIRRRCRSPYRNASPGRWSPSPPRQRHRSRSKSPLPPQRNYRDKSRDRRDRDSPAKKNGRWNANQTRGNSPVRRHRSRSPRRSPPRKRSNSKSPGRRLNRNYNNNNNNNGRRPLRRNSPPPRNGKDRNRDASPAPKKHKSEERSTSRKTPEKAKSRSKSRSLSPGADLAAVLEKLDDEYDMFPILDETEPDVLEETPEVTKPEPAIEEKPKIEIPEEKVEKQAEPIAVKKSLDEVNEDELLGMSDDEISLGGNDIELDDLFNSEDSESENEGRFKSGARDTSNKAKPTPVLPFSKLGASSSSSKVTSELTPSDRKDRNDDRRRREDTGRRDWRSRARQESRKTEENPKEESVVKKFKPLVDDKKRSNTPEVRVPSISSTVKTVAKETSSTPEKRTIQLKRPITANKDDSKVKENITITTGGNIQKKEETTNGNLVRTSIRSRLGGKVDEKETKATVTTRTPISAPGTTAKPVRAKITWKSEKV